MDASDAGLIWSGDHAREFAPYFSRREASMLEHLLVFPLANAHGLQAVLLITETPYFDDHTEYLRIILAAVGDPSARAIHSARIAYASVMGRSIVFKRDEIEVVANRIASRKPLGVRIVLLQLSDLVSQIVTSNDYLDHFRVWQDVLRAVAAFFSSTASVCDADEQRALLLVHGGVEQDTELLVQHVSASLTHLLPEVTAAPVLRYTMGLFPDQGEDLAALARSLL